MGAQFAERDLFSGSLTIIKKALPEDYSSAAPVVLLLFLLRLAVINAERLDRHALHDLGIERLVREIRVALGDLVYCVHALRYLAESGVLAVKVRRLFVHYEEL